MGKAEDSLDHPSAESPKPCRNKKATLLLLCCLLLAVVVVALDDLTSSFDFEVCKYVHDVNLVTR